MKSLSFVAPLFVHYAASFPHTLRFYFYIRTCTRLARNVTWGGYLCKLNTPPPTDPEVTHTRPPTDTGIRIRCPTAQKTHPRLSPPSHSRLKQESLMDIVKEGRFNTVVNERASKPIPPTQGTHTLRVGRRLLKKKSISRPHAPHRKGDLGHARFAPRHRPPSPRTPHTRERG